MSALYTLDELDAEIALIKDALRDAALGKSITVGGKVYEPQDLAQLREHLGWLQAKRSGADGGSRVLAFRPARGR